MVKSRLINRRRRPGWPEADTPISKVLNPPDLPQAKFDLVLTVVSELFPLPFKLTHGLPVTE